MSLPYLSASFIGMSWIRWFSGEVKLSKIASQSWAGVIFFLLEDELFNCGERIRHIGNTDLQAADEVVNRATFLNSLAALNSEPSREYRERRVRRLYQWRFRQSRCSCKCPFTLTLQFMNDGIIISSLLSAGIPKPSFIETGALENRKTRLSLPFFTIFYWANKIKSRLGFRLNKNSKLSTARALPTMQSFLGFLSSGRFNPPPLQRDT